MARLLGEGGSRKARAPSIETRAKIQAPASSHGGSGLCSRNTLKPLRKQALKQLRATCKQGDAAATRDALISWSKTTWPDKSPTSLDEIAKHVTGDLAAEIDKLSRALYGPKATDWDPQAIYTQVSSFSIKEINTDNADSLEPLYR